MKKSLPLIIFIWLVITSSVFAGNARHTIFIDAGSSGSRLYIFEYDGESSLPVIKDIFSKDIKPGLSSYANHPDDAENAVKTLLDDANEYLTSKSINPREVEVNLLATAGMRLLPANQQQALYDHLSNYLKTHYAFQLGEIKTISGKMEGLYGWLNINYLLGNFNPDQKTVGTIDMGGASTQIVFATSNQTKPDDIITLTIHNQPYTVFSKSFLGFGQDQIREKINANPNGYQCYPTGYTFKENNIGHFNRTDCGTIYADILQQQQVKQQMISTENQPFIAYSGIYFAYHFFNADQTPDQFTLESHIENICNQTWEALQKQFPNEKYLSTQCANAIYHDQLLYQTYGLSGSQLKITNNINQQNMNWALGAALYRLTQHKPN